MDRRHFLAQVGSLVVASGLSETHAAEATPAALPTIALGQHRVTRLIAGANPINGYSYLGSHTDQHMREYFTLERTVEFLLACEKAGINTHQFSSGDKRLPEIVSQVRGRGSKLQFICLSSQREELKNTIEQLRPIAMVHHGGVTDRFFAEGKQERIRDYLKAAHDLGVLAGVSAHNPECIRRVADAGWEADFFMTCFYFLTRHSFKTPTEKSPPGPSTLDIVYPFYRDDPAAMTAVVRQVKQPCLGFKILAAGRMCQSQDTVKAAFRYAFQNIKPSDAVIVGMYPRFFDEVSANAGHVREVAKA